MSTRVLLCGLAFGSLAWAATPVARHHVGIVATKALTVALPVTADTSQPAARDLTPVLALAPFGRSAENTGSINAISGNAVPVFSLHGIIVANAKRRSVALISVEQGQALYRQGDAIAGVGLVERITPGQVTIAINGQQVTLYLDDTTVLAAAADARPTQVADAPVSLFERMRAGTVVAAKTERAGPPQTPEQYIDYWRHRIRKNPQAVLQQIGLTPTSAGYVIADKHDSGVRLAGLRPGDLVRSVNGQQVGDPGKDRRFYDQFAASGHARLEVQRGDDILTFSFPLR